MPSAITDELWAELGPLVERAKRSRAGAPASIPDRQFLEALLYPADAGCEWRQLPGRYGAWDAVYNRCRPLAAGVFGRLFTDLPPAAAGLDGVRCVFVDSTTVRAHAPAGAGAGSRPRATSPARTAVAVVLTPGQAGHAPAFDPLWDQAPGRGGGRGGGRPVLRQRRHPLPADR